MGRVCVSRDGQARLLAGALADWLDGVGLQATTARSSSKQSASRRRHRLRARRAAPGSRSPAPADGLMFYERVTFYLLAAGSNSNSWAIL